MSSNGAEHTTAANKPGDCTRDAPTSSPPFDPPEMASCPDVVHFSRIKKSAAQRKSLAAVVSAIKKEIDGS